MSLTPSARRWPRGIAEAIRESLGPYWKKKVTPCQGEPNADQKPNPQSKYIIVPACFMQFVILNLFTVSYALSTHNNIMQYVHYKVLSKLFTTNVF